MSRDSGDFVSQLQELVSREWKMPLQGAYLDSQQGQTLIDVVMQISRNSPPLLLLSFN